MLERLLHKRKATVLKKWFDLVLDTYPDDSKRLFKQKKNQFGNPVGSTIFQELGNIFDEIINEIDKETISPFVERLIKIRAVQDFSPSGALGFIFDLKQIVVKEFDDELKNQQVFREFVGFCTRVDELAMLAFDTYMKCREKIYEIRVNEVKNMTSRVLERSSWTYKISDEDPFWEPEKGTN